MSPRPLHLAKILGSSVLLALISGVTFAAEPGVVFIHKNSSGVKPEVRKARKMERNGGFYVAQLASGQTEKVDAFLVGPVIDLATLQPATLQRGDDVEKAKDAEQRAQNAIKQYPQLGSHLTPALTQLKVEIARVEKGEKKIEGRWISAEEANALAPKEGATIRRGALQLKNGTTYQDVEIISSDSKELRIVHSDGAARVPLSQVPEDFKKKFLTPAAEPAK